MVELFFRRDPGRTSSLEVLRRPRGVSDDKPEGRPFPSPLLLGLPRATISGPIVDLVRGSFRSEGLL
jgi:hypothetical protein